MLTPSGQGGSLTNGDPSSSHSGMRALALDHSYLLSGPLEEAPHRSRDSAVLRTRGCLMEVLRDKQTAFPRRDFASEL